MMIIYKSINEEFRKRLCNTLYYSSIAIFTLCVCLNCSYWGRRSEILGTIAYRVINYLRYGSYILCFLKICFQKHTFDKKFILKIVILAISTLCAFYVEERGLPMLVLLILGAEKMDSKIIAKIVLASQ